MQQLWMRLQIEKDCDPTIVAKTPAELKTKLASKIRQILLKN